MRLFTTLWTVAHQASLQEFSRQEYWNGLPFRSPGGLPNPEIEPGSPALQADSLPSEPPEKPPTYPTSLLHVHLPSNPNDTYLVTDAKVSVLSHLRVFAHTALCGCSTFSLSTWETSMCSLVPRVACLQTATILFLKINLIGGYFTILWWFLSYTDMNQPWVYMCPPSWTPSHLPHPIPWGCPSAPALSPPFHALNLDWWSISHMVIYMFQCYSFKSSHPCLLPQSPKVSSLYLSLLMSCI